MTQTNKLLSSDLDAFRSDGTVQTKSVTFSGTVAAGATKQVTTSTFTLSNVDFYQILFDNSTYSSGKFRDVSLEWGTYIPEVTIGSDLIASFASLISGNNLTITVTLFNPYSSTITLTTTTINFRFVAYDSTLL